MSERMSHSDIPSYSLDGTENGAEKLMMQLIHWEDCIMCHS